MWRKKKLSNFDENLNSAAFKVTYYEFALKILKFKMADENVKIYLIGVKVSIRECSKSLITNPYSKF